MKLKIVLVGHLLFVLCLFNSCRNSQATDLEGIKSISSLKGKYLVDDVFFPQDTLSMKRFRPADSTTTRKLMIEFKNDSIFLSNYHFDGWYGKWFCNFHRAAATFEKGKLSINARLLDNYKCLNEEVWQKIEYQLTEVSGDTLTLIKIMDTTNCKRNWTVYKHLGRGSRDTIELR